MKHNKLLGQHFLNNKKVISQMVESLAVTTGDTIVEVGPGSGVLTEALASACAEKNVQLVAVEKDRNLALGLYDRFPGIEIKHADILEWLPLMKQPYKLIGNIPYYITGSLLRTLGDAESKPTTIILMVQREVAQRICAAPPDMNLLASATQFWAQPRIIASVSRKDFTPPPKVDSSVIVLTPHAPSADPTRYYAFVHKAFKQPRKTLLNNLSEGLSATQKAKKAALLADFGYTAKTRAGELSIEGLTKLANSSSWE